MFEILKRDILRLSIVTSLAAVSLCLRNHVYLKDVFCRIDDVVVDLLIQSFVFVSFSYLLLIVMYFASCSNCAHNCKHEH